MRNGNYADSAEPARIEESSYPTYEEWKLINLRNLSFIKTVLILPMRNGNPFIFTCISFMGFKVLILPMRNGNHINLDVPVYLITVLILPMRNGNQIVPQLEALSSFSSYPTYEEWKLMEC